MNNNRIHYSVTHVKLRVIGHKFSESDKPSNSDCLVPKVSGLCRELERTTDTDKRSQVLRAGLESRWEGDRQGRVIFPFAGGHYLFL